MVLNRFLDNNCPSEIKKLVLNFSYSLDPDEYHHKGKDKEILMYEEKFFCIWFSLIKIFLELFRNNNRILPKITKEIKICTYQFRVKIFQSFIHSAKHIKKLSFYNWRIDWERLYFSKDIDFKWEKIEFLFCICPNQKESAESKIKNIIKAIAECSLWKSLKKLDLTATFVKNEIMKDIVKENN